MIKGLGIDSIELDRIARVYHAYPRRFLDRVYTPDERSYIERWSDPIPRLAARFAVKEACMKALGTGWNLGVRWRDIEVTREPNGKPGVRLYGRARELLALLDADVIHCSITHSRDHAVAVVVFEGE